MDNRYPVMLNHFTSLKFTPEFFHNPLKERAALNRAELDSIKAVANTVYLYQVYPTQADADLLIWCALEISDPIQPSQFFTSFARATNPFRATHEVKDALWGFTRPSAYTKVRSSQEIDPFATDRQPYLVMYPFVKTAEWYLRSKDARQGMMNEHIRIGKQFPDITQLLLYSFGLQDQEFIVVYEMEDLVRFSDLVSELRSSEARRYTSRDTPVVSAIFHPAEETLSLWEAGEG
jgi:chlorite dismutase